MSILSRRARQIHAKGTALAGVLEEWHAVSEVDAAGATFSNEPIHNLIFSLTEQGGCDVSTPDHQVRCAPRRLLLVRPHTAFEERILPQSNWRVSYLIPTGPLVDRFVCAFWADEKSPFRLLETSPLSWQQHVRELIRLSFAQPPHWDWTVLQTLSRLLEELVHHHHEAARQQSLADQAMSTVLRDIQRPWSIEELADTLGVSTSRLAHGFRHEAGASPGQWIRQVRLEHARHLLAQGLSVTEIAQELGYANPFNFTRAYKAAYGVPPSSDRRPAPSILH